jgi:hypothetical protein
MSFTSESIREENISSAHGPKFDGSRLGSAARTLPCERLRLSRVGKQRKNIFL